MSIRDSGRHTEAGSISRKFISTTHTLIFGNIDSEVVSGEAGLGDCQRLPSRDVYKISGYETVTGPFLRKGNSKYKTQLGNMEQREGASKVQEKNSNNFLTPDDAVDHGIVVSDVRGGRHRTEKFLEKLSAISNYGCTRDDEYRRPKSRPVSLSQVNAMQWAGCKEILRMVLIN